MMKRINENLSDHELNCLVVAALGIEEDVHIGERSITRHCIGGSVLRQAYPLDYCNNASDTWRLISTYNITVCGDGYAHLTSSNLPMNRDDIEYWDTNPLRAAVEVFLDMQQD